MHIQLDTTFTHIEAALLFNSFSELFGLEFPFVSQSLLVTREIKS